jgi:L-aspartate oxidase
MGFDFTKDLLPVSPAAHYMVGGIRTNLNGETNIKGLFACGEAASTGVMGANRLASNSLLECLVFGKRTSDRAAKLSKSGKDLPEIKPMKLDMQNEDTFLSYKNEIATSMSKNLGIVRNADDLGKAIDKFTAIAREFTNFDNEYNLMKIYNSATICRLIATAALKREESRGGHIRSDFPKENPDLKIHIIQQKDNNIQFEPVRN